MHLLVSTNDNYVMPLAVLLESLFDNHSESFTIWFMCSDLSDKNRTFFENYIGSHGSALNWIPVSEEAFKGLPTKQYISRETYFRLLAADCLPSDLDRILWLDADMVVNGSISDFYSTDLTGYSVAACPHGDLMRPTMIENCEAIGIRDTSQYFNAGVMLCNLDMWRQMDIAERIRTILSAPHKFKFPGQDLTNLIFNGSVLTCDWEQWNCMTHSIASRDLPKLTEKARIIHYTGFAKPWTFTDIPFADVWMTYFEKSPFRGTKLRRTSYFKMKEIYRKAWEKTNGPLEDPFDN